MAHDVFSIAGTRQGAFTVEKVVAEGAFDVVYRAYYDAFRTPVALKCLKIPVAMSPAVREELIEHFREEAAVLFCLSASIPAIVRPLHADVLSTSTGALVPFIALEWLDGETLASHIASRKAAGLGPFDPGQARRLLTPVARALEAAHHFPGADGPICVVHRDIKPANLFLANINGEQVVKILDFGIARVRDSVVAWLSSVTAGPVAFRPDYASPEQWLPKRFGATGPWTDVWGLALTFVELVIGHPPLEGDVPAIMGTALDDKHRPTPRSEGAVVSDAVEDVVRRALAVDPRNRQKDAGVFWDELEAALGVPRSSSLRLRQGSQMRLAAASESILLPRGRVRLSSPKPEPRPPATKPSALDEATDSAEMDAVRSAEMDAIISAIPPLSAEPSPQELAVKAPGAKTSDDVKSSHQASTSRHVLAAPETAAPAEQQAEHSPARYGPSESSRPPSGQSSDSMTRQPTPTSVWIPPPSRRGRARHMLESAAGAVSKAALGVAARVRLSPRATLEAPAAATGLNELAEARLPPAPPWATAYRPSWILPRRQSSLHVYVFRPEAKRAIDVEAQAALGASGNRARGAHVIPLYRALRIGELLAANVELAGFSVGKTAPMAWSPPFVRFVIPILAPEGVAIGSHRPIVSVHSYRPDSAGELLAQFDFDIEVRDLGRRRSLAWVVWMSGGIGTAVALATAVQQNALPPLIGLPTSAVCLAGSVGAWVVTRPNMDRAEARDISKVFISYAREDIDRVRQAVSLLRAVGRFPWIDVEQLLGGDRWETRVEEAIERADRFFLFWSCHARASQWVTREWEHALGRAQREASFIVPVMLDADRPENDHPLAQFQYVFLDGQVHAPPIRSTQGE